jgi:alpha-beta hydrolase superfamily lysophospholipase
MTALSTADGVALHRIDWPAPGMARGRVLVVHGLGEHSGRYAGVAAVLAAQGWDVSSYDQRGHGRSGGARGALPAPDSLLADLARAVDDLRPRTAGPLVLMGHSLGGLVAARFVAEALGAVLAPWSRPVDALVLSSPALDAGMSAAQKALLAVLGPLAPDLALGNGLKSAWLSRDPAVVRAYDADPLVHDRVTPRLARFIVDAGRFVLDMAPHWRVPTLLLYAGADRCVAPAGSGAFAAAAPPGIVTAQVFPVLFHEILNEPERDQVLQHLSRWLDNRG